MLILTTEKIKERIPHRTVLGLVLCQVALPYDTALLAVCNGNKEFTKLQPTNTQLKNFLWILPNIFAQQHVCLANKQRLFYKRRLSLDKFAGKFISNGKEKI